MNVVYLTDAEYQQWVAEHKTKPQATQDQQQ
jgi:heme/copper-type cytochrome/quinol oxidase subunit 2